MVQHICNRCGYTTIRKQNLRSHLLRKNLCNPEMNEMDRYNLLVLNGFDKESKMYEKTHFGKKFGSKSINSAENCSESSDEIFIKDGKLKCSHCDKTFAKKEYLEKHMKMYCKMLIQFNNIYDFKNMKLGREIYKSKNAGDIYIIQIDYLNYDYYKVGISSNLEQRIKDYRCGNTYEPRLYYYIPCRDIKAIDKELNNGLSEFNVKREIFNGEVDRIKNKIISIVKNKYPSDDVKAYEPEIKIGDFTECNHCKKCFFNSSALYEHFKICDEYKEEFNKYSKGTHICSHCNRSKWRHEKTCKQKKENDKIILIEERNKILQEQLDKRDEQINELLKLLEKQIKNNSKPNLNKGVINNAKQQINNNNVTINNFGSENIDYITAKVFYKLLNTPYNAIPKLIELKHFNPKHPENHNVKITNIHDKYAKIYKDKKWIIQHKTDVLETMIDNGFADLEEFKNLNEEEFTDKFMDKYNLVEHVIEKGNVKEKVLLISKNGTDRMFKNDIIV